MHENLTITDGVYGVLSEVDIRKRIMGLGQRIVSDKAGSIEESMSLNKEILKRLKQR